MAPRPFLAASWRWLLLLQWEVDEALLRPLLPAGTELDPFRGRHLVSLVGFRFLDTRVRGCRIPGHVDFDEANLRFYVRREERGALRRGVAFVREVVPRRLIAAVARLVYGEPYVARPMASSLALDGDPLSIRYTWRDAGETLGLEARARAPASLPAVGSEAAFLTEHYWGYTSWRGHTREYEVRHPRWACCEVSEARALGPLGRFYGPAWAEPLAAEPCSAVLAVGSEVTVHPGARLSRS